MLELSYRECWIDVLPENIGFVEDFARKFCRIYSNWNVKIKENDAKKEILIYDKSRFPLVPICFRNRFGLIYDLSVKEDLIKEDSLEKDNSYKDHIYNRVCLWGDIEEEVEEFLEKLRRAEKREKI